MLTKTTRICPDCNKGWEQQRGYVDKLLNTHQVCSSCLELRRDRLRLKDVLASSVGETKPPIQLHPYSDVPQVLVGRPGSNGRRVIRKGNIMS